MQNTDKDWTVYIHISPSNKAYIGITSQLPNDRWGSNGCNYCKENHRAFHNAIKKYGWDNFQHIIWAENLSKEEAKTWEIRLIALFKTNCCKYRNPTSGYNMTDGGDGNSGWVPTDEFKKKQSAIHKEQWLNKEFRDRMLQIRKDENGPYKSKEFRDKISSIVQGENNPNYNNRWTDEMKNNLSKKRIESGIAANENNPMATKIVCLETGEVFNLIKYALEKYKIKDHSNMSVALREPIRTAGGVHWAIYDDAFLDDNFRISRLIEVCSLCKRYNPTICIEDMVVYANGVKLAKAINLTKSYVDYHLSKDGELTHDGKTYMKLSKYINREGNV